MPEHSGTGQAARQLRARYLAELAPSPANERYLPELRKAVAQANFLALNNLPTPPDLPALPAAEQVLVWSDLHLGHDNIIRYTGRPYADVAEMDAALYANWAAAVGPADSTLFIGDVAMRQALTAATWQAIRNGPGQAKWLVLGNHDLTGSGQLRVAGFDQIIGTLYLAGAPPLFFSHVPLREVPDGLVNVHGHMHDEPPGHSPHINVSVEQLAFRPVPLSDLQALARELVRGHYPAGRTTLERIQSLRGTAAPR